MPEIPLLSRGKALGPLPSFWILLSIMLSPKEVGSAESFLAIVSGSSSYSTLLEQTISKFAKASTGGAIAGEVFLQLLQLILHGYPTPSVGKAVFIVSEDLKRTRLYSGKAAPHHVDRVHRFWAKFRPAAHLWAAFRLEQDAGRAALSPNFSDSEIGALNDNIILCSDLLLSKAVAAKMTFDPNPWELPSDYPRKSFHISVPPPTDWAIERLKKYRAPARSRY